MVKLIFVRHGQSVANLENIFAGHYNAELTQRGHMQAEKTAEYIAEKYKPDVIYASDLKRAYSTAEHISEKTGAEIIAEPLLREINCGDWDAKKFSDLLIEYPEEYGVWVNDIGKAVCNNGESVAEIKERVISVLNRIICENDGKMVVVVSHATPIRVMQTTWSGIALENMKDVPWVSNASVTVVNCADGKFEFEKISYDGYMAELATELPPNV